MLTLLKQLSFCISKPSTRTRTIIITPFSHFINYTFLAIDPQVISPSFQQKVKKAQSRKLIQLLQKLNSNASMFEAIKAEDYGYVDLDELEHGKIVKNRVVNDNLMQIMKMKSLFMDVREQMIDLINQSTVLLWLDICRNLQIIDIQIWNKLISHSISIYEQSSTKDQLSILTAIRHYLKNKYSSYTFLPSKFVYPEEFLLDLVPLKKIIRSIIKTLHRARQPGDQTIFTAILIQMIQKISKISNTNFMQYIILVKDNLICLQSLTNNGNLQTVLNIYKLYAIIGLYQQKMIIRIQERIVSLLVELANEKMMNLVNKLLSIWSIFNHHNASLYVRYMKPFIERHLDSHAAIRFRSIWLHNLLSSGISDQHIITKLHQQVDIDLPMSNKYVHIVNHYLSIVNHQKGLSSYPNCAQHPAILNHLLKNRKVYSNCMQRQAKGHQFNSQTFVHNSVQDIWLKMLQKAFLILTPLFPSENNQIFFNFYFCVFELDALMILGDKPIAFELIGNHYMLKNLQSSIIDGKKHGKKVLKYKIIEAYGIQILQIHSGGIIQRTISSFDQTEKGVGYLCKLITDILRKTP